MYFTLDIGSLIFILTVKSNALKAEFFINMQCLCEDMVGN